MKHDWKIFAEYGTSGKKMQWVDNPEWFARWKDGQTGMPLVDANMREIKQTGECSEASLTITYSCQNVHMNVVMCFILSMEM